MERAINTTADGLGRLITFSADHWLLFGIFAILWAAFAAGLVASQGSLHEAWLWLRGLHWLLQGLIWLLFLPVALGLWIWETTWPLVLRLVLVASLAGWNLLVLIPRAAR